MGRKVRTRRHTKAELRTALSVITGTEADEDAGVGAAGEPWAYGPGIQGFGIGRRIRGGRLLPEQVVRVYVDRKVPYEEMDSEHRIPRSIKVPGIRQPVPIDVFTVGQLELESGDRIRPIASGCGIGGGGEVEGTLGLFVRRRDDTDGALHFLSNAHVVAQNGFGTVDQDEVLQPCARSGGRSPDDLIGILNEFAPLRFSDRGFPNFVDAAIARVTPTDREISRFIPLLGEPRGTSNQIRERMTIRKFGARTGFTTGTVIDPDAEVAFGYAHRDGGVRRAGFRNVVLCTNYSLGGDSGAAILNEAGEVVGLHIGGSDRGSVFCRIRHVFSLLRLTLA
jgi:hypothetical protein